MSFRKIFGWTIPDPLNPTSVGNPVLQAPDPGSYSPVNYEFDFFQYIFKMEVLFDRNTDLARRFEKLVRANNRSK